MVTVLGANTDSKKAVGTSVKRLKNIANKKASLGSNIARGIALIAVVGAIANLGLEMAESLSKKPN